MSEKLHLRGREEKVDDFRVEKPPYTSNAAVCSAYLLDETEKVVDATPRQTIMKYVKWMSKQEGTLDHYSRGSFHDVDLNRALTHWLSCANLPWGLIYNVISYRWKTFKLSSGV